MTWCFSTRSSVATVLKTHPRISSCLWVKQKSFQYDHIRTYTAILDQDKPQLIINPLNASLITVLSTRYKCKIQNLTIKAIQYIHTITYHACHWTIRLDFLIRKIYIFTLPFPGNNELTHFLDPADTEETIHGRHYGVSCYKLFLEPCVTACHSSSWNLTSTTSNNRRWEMIKCQDGADTVLRRWLFSCWL